MRKQGRGATTRKHGPRWVCPVAESEVYKDADGHLHRVGWAEHRETRVWSADDPDIAAQLIPDHE